MKLLTTGLTICWLLWSRSLAAADQPNILFIFSDDHAQHAISAYGSRVNHTPHLDRLAEGGAWFINSWLPQVFSILFLSSPSANACGSLNQQLAVLPHKRIR